MDEHVIRLRAGWEWTYGEAPPGESEAPDARSYPPPGPTIGIGRSDYSRRFGRPARKDDTEAPVRLKLATVPGLVRVSLNRVALPVSSSDTALLDGDRTPRIPGISSFSR